MWSHPGEGEMGMLRLLALFSSTQGPNVKMHMVSVVSRLEELVTVQEGV